MDAEGAELIPMCWQIAADTVLGLTAAGAPAAVVLLILLHSVRLHSDAAEQVRFLERRSLVTALVLFIAWLPWHPVSVPSLGQTILIPPGWSLWLQTTQAVNQQVGQRLRSEDALQQRAAALAIADLEQSPELASEYGQFQQQCYLPARRKAARLDMPADFADWAGAPTLTDTPGFYSPCGDSESAACKRGFLSALQPVLSLAGRNDESASCKKWWAGGKQGLKNRLTEALQRDAAPVWDGKLSQDDAEAWLRNYLLGLSPELNLWNTVAETAKKIFNSNFLDLGRQAVSRLGSAALVWKLGAEGILFLVLLQGLISKIQILLLALLALLWPGIAVFSGFNPSVMLRTALAYTLIKLWTALGAVGTFMHQVIWQLAAGEDTSITALALNFSNIHQLALWYLAASLPWAIPLLGSWIFWRLIHRFSPA